MKRSTMEPLPVFNNIILLSGTDRNVGKTQFACELISRFAGRGITGLKISPHWHIPDHPENIIFQDENFLVMEEKNRDGHKDSSRMLVSGASRVFYIQATDEHLGAAFNFLTRRFPALGPVVCESAALGKIISPAAHFRLCRSHDDPEIQPGHGVPVSHFIISDGKSFDFDMGRVSLSGNNWIISG